jgi:hypothetical protein
MAPINTVMRLLFYIGTQGPSPLRLHMQPFAHFTCKHLHVIEENANQCGQTAKKEGKNVMNSMFEELKEILCGHFYSV